MVAHGDHLKPNWCTEIGGSARKTTLDHPNRYLTFTEQETHLADAIQVLQAGYVTNLERIYWYCLFDSASQVDFEQTFGLVALNATNPIVYSGSVPLDEAPLTPKPAYSVYKNAAKVSTGGAGGADIIMDDDGTGYSDSGDWILSSTSGYGGGYYHDGNTGTTTSKWAKWVPANLPDATYNVYVFGPEKRNAPLRNMY